MIFRSIKAFDSLKKSWLGSCPNQVQMPSEDSHGKYYESFIPLGILLIILKGPKYLEESL